MIYNLKDILKDNKNDSVINYINEQISTFLDRQLNVTELYKLSCTTSFFIDMDEEMNIRGILIMTHKTFLFEDRISFIEFLSSKDDDHFIEQSLILKCISYLSSTLNQTRIISLVSDTRVQEEALAPFGFMHSHDIMIKL